MEQLQEITEYVRTMKMKKAFFGGYDREDVYKKLGDIVQLFEKYVMELTEAQKEQIEVYEQRLQTSDMLITELNRQIGALSLEQKNMDQEKEKMKAVYKEYCSNVLQQYSESLRTLSSEFTQILENVTSLQKSILDVDLLDVFEEKVEEIPQDELKAMIETSEEAAE